MKWELLGFREQGYLPIMENQMDKNTKNEMETTIYRNDRRIKQLYIYIYIYEKRYVYI